MARRVLLLSLNRFALPDAVFPLGLAHLSSALRRAGHEVRWLDFLADNASLQAVLDEFRPDAVGISLRNIDDVNIIKRERLFEGVVSLTQTLRKTVRAPLILGGSGYSIFPEQLMDMTGADYGVRGEGEASLVALLDALSNGSDVAGIPGLVWREKGDLRMNPPARDLGAETWQLAEYPDHLVDYYLKQSGMLNVQTQRGCALDCCYCTYPLIEGRHHRWRPPEQVVEELKRLEHRGVKYVCIVDSVFNSSPAHVTAVCEAILKQGLRIKWGCFLRPAGLTQELVRLMARAGLSHAEFGSDSFCDEVLEAYGKSFRFSDILQANEMIRQHDIESCHFLICGGPGETEETMEITFDHSKQLQAVPILAVVGMRVYPGTILCQRAISEGVILPEADLVEPSYYLAPGLTEAGVLAQLEAWVRKSPNWIVGDPDPSYSRMVERLRGRGVVGPLWSYFAMMQRLQPRALTQPQS